MPFSSSLSSCARVCVLCHFSSSFVISFSYDLGAIFAGLLAISFIMQPYHVFMSAAHRAQSHTKYNTNEVIHGNLLIFFVFSFCPNLFR